MRFVILGLSTLIMFSVFAGGDKDCVKGIGEAIKEKRIVGKVNTIELDGSIDVYLYQSDKDYVHVEAQFNIIPLIVTENIDGVLYIRTKKGECYNSTKSISIHVYSKEFQNLTINGSGDIYNKTNIKGTGLKLFVNGSGDIDLANVKLQSMDVAINGSGDVNVNSIDTVEALNLNINGSGDINLIDAPGQEVIINIQGSGDIKVHAVDNLTVEISGSGDVQYKGTPIVQVEGKGEVKKIN